MFNDTHHSWRKLSYFISSENTQKYLFTSYKQLQIPDAEKLSFQNCYPFIYYLTHGKNYYETAATAPLSIKPVLLFYGMIQLLKGCILTIDPTYPDTTAVLAHGVTTRKRKKQDYEFLEDEVKIQKNGLFTHIASNMFHLTYSEGEKFNMFQLLKRIPELENLLSPKERLLAIQQSEDRILVPKVILDSLNMTETRFSTFFSSSFPSSCLETLSSSSKEYMHFKLDSPSLDTCFIYNLFDKTYHLPKYREELKIFPELLIHYLLLYNLSMICRYETDWWGDLLHNYSSTDYPYISQFLLVTFEKVPYYIEKFLLKH